MAKFTAVVLKHRKGSDGRYNVKIRISHHGKIKYLPTSLYACKQDLTRNLDIKQGGGVYVAAQDIISKYLRVTNNYTNIDNISMDDLVRLLGIGSDPVQVFSLDFFEYASLKAISFRDGHIGKSKLIITTINSLKAFVGRDKLDISEINKGFLTRYVDWLNSQGNKGRAPSLYCSNIRMLHNLAKSEYNDEDMGVINIPQSPFSSFKVPKENVPEKKALSLVVVRKLAAMPYDKPAHRGLRRSNLAKDCFFLSFFLMGMNTADLFEASEYVDGYIIYYRAKTKTRRSDRAEMRIKVPDCCKPLFDKYRDPSKERVFLFHKYFASAQDFNSAVNDGLGKLCHVMEIPKIQFYAARHTWATIANNRAGVDKYTVHEALCHVMPEMKITDRYIERDWSKINEANQKVIEYCGIEMWLVF